MQSIDYSPLSVPLAPHEAKRIHTMSGTREAMWVKIILAVALAVMLVVLTQYLTFNEILMVAAAYIILALLFYKFANWDDKETDKLQIASYRLSKFARANGFTYTPYAKNKEIANAFAGFWTGNLGELNDCLSGTYAGRKFTVGTFTKPDRIRAYPSSPAQYSIICIGLPASIREKVLQTVKIPSGYKLQPSRKGIVLYCERTFTHRTAVLYDEATVKKFFAVIGDVCDASTRIR